MYDFVYHRPHSLRSASAMINKAEDGKLLAGGQTLLPTMKQRLAAPSDLIDLGQVPELKGIEIKGRNVVIGAMSTHAEVNQSAAVGDAIPALAALAGGIGDPQVRHKGTIGGSIANNDPAADYPSACLALNATIITNRRKIMADEFFKGMFETALEAGEMIKAVSFPIPAKAAYAKFPNPASRYAIVGVFVAKKGKDVRVAVTGAGSSGVFRSSKLEAALTAKFSSKSLDGVTVSADGLNADLHAGADYRAHLIGVLAARAVDAAK